MAELSSGNDDKSVSRTGSFKLFGKSPSRNLLKKSSSNPFKRIFSKKKSDKQISVSEGERDESISNAAETEIIEDDAPTIVEKIEKVVPKVIEEIVHQMKIADPVIESKDSTPASEEKKPESLAYKLKEETEKINEELLEKAKESGLEELYNKAINPQPQTPQSDQPLDDNQTQERSLNIDELKGDNQDNIDKEENCVSSLAQGLQKICAQWNTKKED